MSKLSNQRDSGKQELDPEIADLLGLTPDETTSKPKQPPKEIAEPKSTEPELTESKVTQKETSTEESTPIDLAAEDEFLKIVIENENEKAAQTLLKNKQFFQHAKTKEEKSLYREKFGAAYWNFYRTLAPKVIGDLALEKKLCLRYNLLDTTIISKPQLEMIQAIPLEDEDDSIYYIDEWMANVAQGNIKASIIDETIIAKKREGAVAQERLEKRKGQRESEIQVIKARVDQVQVEESRLRELVKEVEHETRSFIMEDAETEELLEPYSSVQRESLSQVVECCKTLVKLDRDLKGSLKTLNTLEEDISKLSEEADSGVDADESNKVVFEFNVAKQMIKMCVGRQGNHFPILLQHYFNDEINQVAIKSNIRKVLKDVEFLDPSVFIRLYKGESHRIMPYMVIVPCYGDYGICWDPIPKENRATGKGRLAIPFFPKNLKHSVLAALADLRWQVAKEKAQHYWMEEGLTGRYYDYYTTEKLKGDIKRYFMQDYLLWIIWESQGIQKLHKDVRSVFWRMMPFPQDKKEELKNKGYYYSELYQKDKTREKSVGY